MDEIDGASWRKSSYSGSNGGACVEVGQVPGRVLVRDTTDREGPKLAFGRGAWAAFAVSVKASVR